MPIVQPTEQSISEGSQQQLDSQESLHNNVLEKIKGGDAFKSFDLPADEEIKKVPSRQQPVAEEEPTEEEQTQEEETQEETQEEVIPKSKVQPRFDQMTARIKRLEQELEEQKKVVPVDDIQRQLDEMDENTLEETLIQTRLAKEDSKTDPAKRLEFTRLERRIEKQIAVAPQKFAQNQVNEANRTINRLVGEGEITDANYPEVLKIAKSIYEKYPKMQKTLDGQSMAFELATEHYKSLGKVSSVKEDTQNLKGQINNLKKRTALDTKAVKGGGDKVNLDKLRNNAMTGSMKDKEKYLNNDSRFKVDSMIPDFLKG